MPHYTIDSQGLIQAAAETVTTFRDAVQMWEASNTRAFKSADQAMKAEREMAKGMSTRAFEAHKKSFDTYAADSRFYDAESLVLKAIIAFRWPVAAGEYFK